MCASFLGTVVYCTVYFYMESYFRFVQCFYTKLIGLAQVVLAKVD